MQNSRRIRVLALTRYERLGASSRVRFYQYLSYLRAFGVEVEVYPLVDDGYLRRLYLHKPASLRQVIGYFLVRLSKLVTIKEYDLIWLEKELFPNLPAWLEEIFCVMGVHYIVDYDDAVFHNYDLSRNSAKRLLAHKIDRVMRNAALVVCGNRYLAERALSAGARRIEIIPTVIDLERYTVKHPPKRKHIVVGWMGSPTTVKYLELVVSALKALSAECAVQLRVIGATFSSTDIEIDCRPWLESSEVSEIQDFDIGIMPLVDGPWERGKCGYKLIQYMACGKPVIASPVGVNQEILEPGTNGYLAKDSSEWLAAFQALSMDTSLREKMGLQGRISVEKKYCIQVTTPLLAQFLREAAGT